MRGSITVQLLLFSLVFITLCISSCEGAKACCEKAQRLLEAQERAQAQAQVPEAQAPETQQGDEITIDDIEEEEEAPDEYNGQKRWIADPSAEKPEDWDDEDDGEWQPRLIENPEYEWKPKEELKTPSLCSQHEELETVEIEQAVEQVEEEESLLDKLVFELEEAMGWIILGIFITALMSFASTDNTNNTNFFSLSNIRENLIYYHEKNTFVGLFMAGILGLCTPLCSCGALPLASSLAASSSNNVNSSASSVGLLPLANVLTFLTASQSAGLDSAAITLGLLGPVPALFRLFGALFISIVVGYFTFPSSSTNNNNNNEENKDETKEEKDLCDDTSSCCPSHTHTHTSSTTSNTTTSTTTTTTTLIQDFLNTLQETSLDIFPTVLSGIVLSTLILHFFPSLLFGYHHQADSTLSSSLTLSSFLIRLGILLSALPIQLCEHSSVTFAAGIQKSGGSPGIAFAFLLSAPATNISCLLLLLKTQLFHQSNKNNDKNKNKFNYNAFVTVMRMSLSLCGAALLLSYVVDFFGMDMLVDKQQTEQNMYLKDDDDKDHSHENMTQEELELHLAEGEDHHHHHDHNDWFHFTSISLAIILWVACVKHFVTTKIMTHNKNGHDDKLDECCDHTHHTHHTQNGHNKLKQS